MTHARALQHATARHEPARAVSFDPQMQPDLERWRDEEPKTALRVVELIETVIAHPKKGRGRPKRLAGLPGVWSRRITRHHRLYYIIEDGTLRFVSCWNHDMPQHIEQQLREGV